MPDPTWIDWASGGGALGGSAAVVHFCLRWVKEVVDGKSEMERAYFNAIKALQEERARDLAEWNEFLRADRERSQETIRLVSDAVSHLARIETALRSSAKAERRLKQDRGQTGGD